MKKLWGPVGIVVSCFVLGGTLSGCGQQAKTAQEATSTKIQNKLSAAAFNKNVAKPLETIREKFEGKSHLLVLEKEYWINKRIWVSIGIERASVTGMAGSVIGYIPTYLRQVNQLLVLERDNTGRFAGTALTPEIALNAYPIVDENEAAIVVDVASPRTEYGLTNIGFYAGPMANTELQPRLEYVKDVTIGAEGVAFKSVINAVSPVPLFKPGEGTPEEAAGLDPFSISLTVRTDWRLPTPTADYVALDAAAQPFGFFTSAPKIENGGLSSRKFVQRIATGRKQVWEMSPNTPAAYQSAIREGIMAWNEALGGDVLEVRLGQVGKDNTDPATSNVIWDDNKAVGFAFANWRDNPDTGEIIQGQVYMSGDMWAEQGGLVYDLRRLEKLLRESLDAIREAEQNPKQKVQTPPLAQQPGEPPASPVEASRELIAKVRGLQKQIAASTAKLKREIATPHQAKRGFLSLNAAHGEEIAHAKGFCQRDIDINDLRDTVAAVVSIEGDLSATTTLAQEIAPSPDTQQSVADAIKRTLKHMPYPAEDMTRAQFQAHVVRSVVMHEVGHALGLRHNFMGSLETSDEGKVESASIMDYNDLVVDAQFARPGDSDMAVIKMGYLRVPPARRFKFCTDENVGQGTPGCHRHDYSADPVDFFVTSQETSLIMGLYFAQQGDMSGLLRSINSSLRTGLELVNYINTPTLEGMQVDPQFGEKQTRAFTALIEGRQMYDLPFPREITAVYSNLSRMVMGTSIKEGAGHTTIKPALIKDLSDSVLDGPALMDRDSRMSGVLGLLKLQDSSARSSLKTLFTGLDDQSKKQDAERNLDSRMMDEFMQRSVQRALDDYFAVTTKGSQR